MVKYYGVTINIDRFDEEDITVSFYEVGTVGPDQEMLGGHTYFFSEGKSQEDALETLKSAVIAGLQYQVDKLNRTIELVRGLKPECQNT